MSNEESKVLDELERFKDWASGAYSKQTVVAYISALRGYFNFYGGVPTLEDPEVEAEIAKEYIKEGTEAQRQKWTYALKAYYNFRGRPDIAAMIPKYRCAYSFAGTYSRHTGSCGTPYLGWASLTLQCSALRTPSR